MSLRATLGVVAWMSNRHCKERSDVAIQKNNKKVLILAFFTGLLRQLLCNFLRNDDLVTTQQFQNMGRVTGFEPVTLRTTT